MYFNADLHVHSIYSKDSKNKIKDIIKICKLKGINCIAITDHNTIRGSKKCKEFVKKNKIDIEVILSSEIKTDIGEVIGYHITEEIKPDKFECVIDEIKSQGGYICIPHAFDIIRNGVVPTKIKDLKKIDFLEINARSLWFFNKKTEKFSKMYKMKLLASSDAHTLSEIGRFQTILSDIKKIKVREIKTHANIFYPFYPLLRTKIYKIFKSSS